jgi:hypothetical protein
MEMCCYVCCVAMCDLQYVRVCCYVRLCVPMCCYLKMCEDVLLCAASDYVFVYANMSYYEMILYLRPCVTMCCFV